MTKVYSARDVGDAHLIRGMLEAEGIVAIVQGESLGVALGHIALSAGTTPTVWVVNDEDVQRASVLVHAGGSARPQFCPQCGYDLRGPISPRCPECGRSFPDPQPWVCPTCGETIEGQFAECWKCAAPGEEL